MGLIALFKQAVENAAASHDADSAISLDDALTQLAGSSCKTSFGSADRIMIRSHRRVRDVEYRIFGKSYLRCDKQTRKRLAAKYWDDIRKAEGFDKAMAPARQYIRLHNSRVRFPNLGPVESYFRPAVSEAFDAALAGRGNRVPIEQRFGWDIVMKDLSWLEEFDSLWYEIGKDKLLRAAGRCVCQRRPS